MSNERKRWTLKESDRAIELSLAGTPFPAIAAELGRTAAAVEQHISKRRNPSSMLNQGASKKTKMAKATKTGFSFYDFAVGVVIGFSAASVAASYLI